MKKQLVNNSVIPVRLEEEQNQRLEVFQEETGLSKSFIIRRCINFALEKFASREVDVLTLQEFKKLR
jgi:predicted DNA-binding protein